MDRGRRVTIVSAEDFEARRRTQSWPTHLRHKMRLRMGLRDLAFWVRHARMAAAQRNGTF
jgi:hypothetical protein